MNTTRRSVMVRFYDPKDKHDMARVESILRKAGIEYCLGSESIEGLGPWQIQVAEEDVPKAEELLRLSERR
jgi:aspartokinase